MKSKKYAIYVKKSSVMIETRKKSDIIAIAPEELIRGAAHSRCNLRYKVPKKFQ